MGFGSGTRKRRVMTSELAGKFRSKQDFMRFFKDHLQLYVPPEVYINKDFLKQVFRGEKDLLALAQVKYVNVPLYDELSVKSIFETFKHDEKFMRYMPDPQPGSRLPNRTYFYNVLNTLQPDYVE